MRKTRCHFLKVSLSLVLCFLLIYAAAPAVSAKSSKLPSRALPSTSGALKVKGTKLVDSKGKTVQLKGVSTHGLAWFPQYVNKNCFKQLREDFNANVVRLAMYTSEYSGYCNGGDQAALKKLIRKGVSYATANDLYVIIDWHILSDSNPNTHKKAAIKFFDEMSEEYADSNNVIYEICNEPNGGTSWSEIKSYAVDVIKTIRANDKDGVILVGTPNWSQYVDQAAADPITGYKNIMYTLHFYAATHTDSLRNTMVQAIEDGLPIFVSEYGICDASGNGSINEKQANLWAETLDQYKISYVAWSLCNKAESASILRSDCTKTSGFSKSDLSDSGKWLFDMLTGKNGTLNGSSDSSSGSSDSSSDNGSGSSSGDSNSSSGTSGSSDSSSGVSGSLSYTASVTNSWESGGQTFYQYNVTVKNTASKACSSWSITIPFTGSVTLSNGWNGDYTVKGSKLYITSKDYNGQIAAGGKVSDIGFIISGSSDLEVKETASKKTLETKTARRSTSKNYVPEFRLSDQKG